LKRTYPPVAVLIAKTEAEAERAKSLDPVTSPHAAEARSPRRRFGSGP
jgi:hypothetical protein